MDGASPAKLPALLIGVALASAVGSGAAVMLLDRSSSSFSLRGQEQPLSPSCNVLGIQVHGNIVATRADIPPSDTTLPADASSTITTPNYTVSSDIEDTLRYASTDPSIKALLIDVDSFGGGAVAGNEIALAIRRFGRPSVAVIHEIGASSGYLAAAAADTVFASEDSSVGSIGATSSFLNQSEKNKKEGILYEQLSSGPYKDLFSSDKPLTDAERALIMRDVKISRDNFVKMVADFRHQPVAKIDALADGSTMMGKAALDNGLIDAFGGTWDAIDYLTDQLGEPANVCWQ